MPKTKTPAKLTVTQATSQARRHVDKLMPGVMATVDSKLTADQGTLAPLVRTVITFPANHHAAQLLSVALLALPGRRDMKVANSSITIIRER